MIKKISSLLVFATMIVAMLFLNRCKPDTDPVKAINKSFPEKVNQLSGQTPSEISVIIDVTGSMRGFSNPNYGQFLIKLNSAFNKNKVKVNYYALNENLNLICSNEEPEKFAFFLNPQNYTSERTDLKLISKQITPKSALLFLTDMQYNSQEQNLANINQFQSFLGLNYMVMFYGTNLFFNGKVFCFDYNINRDVCIDANYSGNRPYYASLVTPSSSSYGYFNRILSDLPLGKNKLTYVKKTKSNIEIKDMFSYNFIPQQQYCNMDGKNYSDIYHVYGSGDTLSCQIKIKNQLFPEWHPIKIGDIKAEFFNFASDSSLIIDKSIQFEISSVATDNDDLVLKLKSKQNIDNTGIITISILPTKLPTWIDLFNCEQNDQIMKKKDHTLDLNNFLINITADRNLELTKVYIYIEQ